ncbi:accessory gene regulator B family protein [Brevibacillus migulae]|uniref:accessory gene regulator B family protein n=1 Tax=Brevibacillus migulae TaxID=1644114 RepID=UPI001431FF65|nr:accessory gene regulator B family protein [Brevibacillus migulae]
MSWTERTATRLAERIKTPESPYSVAQISHGIEMVIMYFLNSFALLFLAWLWGILMEACLLAFFYILHRSFTGGLHLKSVWSCMVGGVSTMLLFAYLVKVLPAMHAWTYMLVALLFACSFVINYRYAPAEHTYVSTQESIKKACRKIILGLLVFGCISSEFLVFFNYEHLAMIYATAVFLQSMHLLPLSYQLAFRLETIFERIDWRL